MSDVWTHDPGFLPEDPRHGLSPQGLVDHYNARPVQWLIRSTYGPLGLARRDGATPAHREYLYPRRHQIYFLGPTLADDNKTPIGSWVMIDVPSRADALAFIAREGFVQAGMIDRIDISRFVETSPTPRRQLEMRAREGMQLFLCELTDGSEGAEKRMAVGATHYQYQKSIADDLIARGEIRSDDNKRSLGTLYIIQAKDRAAAESLVKADPLVRAGAFANIRIEHWRFGGAIAHPPDQH